MNNKTELLELINDMEILLKQDKRFHLSNDHEYRSKIKNLAKSKNLTSGPIDITPLVNLAKLQAKPPEVVTVNQTVQVSNTESLKNIVAKLSELNKKMDNIVD